MIRIVQLSITLYLTVLLASCASNPQATSSNSAQATRAEIQARQSDADFCDTISTMTILIVTSRHLLPQTRQELGRDMKSRYPGYDNIIASMIDEAYEQKPLGSIGEATNAASQLKSKWINDLTVCEETPTQFRQNPRPGLSQAGLSYSGYFNIVYYEWDDTTFVSDNPSRLRASSRWYQIN